MGFLSDRKEKKERERVALDRFTKVAGQIATGDREQVASALGQLRADSALTYDVPAPVRQPIATNAFRSFAGVALADDRLTEDEEQELLAAADALEIGLRSEVPDLFARLAVAQANEGRLGSIENPHRILPKQGEVVHIQTDAALLKEVAIRQWQGGYGGVGFRVAKGVTFRTGHVKGKSVVVGSEIKIEDTGVLSVTSSRVSYLGDRKTVDIPFSKLVGLDVFSDGLTLQSSSRQNAILLRVNEGYGEVVAATINAAMQHTL